MKIFSATQNLFPAALELLKKNGLPADDISGATHLFVLSDKEEVMGTVALEYSGENGLLRSLCVADKIRNKGAGWQLVQFIEEYARERGVTNLYLLTTTADHYFGKRGFAVMNRQGLPDTIKQTSEFASVCPSSAIVIKKYLV